jgi:hypothetical protein
VCIDVHDQLFVGVGPPEIWSAVFLIVVESNPTNLPRLMFVSRTWYCIASSSPRLWARLEFKQLKHFTSPRYVNTFLTNSGARLLDVFIHVTPETEDTSRLTVLLRKHVSRFRTLVLRVKRTSSLPSVMPSLPLCLATRDQRRHERSRYKNALLCCLWGRLSSFNQLHVFHLSLPAHPLPTNAAVVCSCALPDPVLDM